MLMADTKETRARNQLVAMLPFEDAQHCEYFTDAERATIMAAVNRVKAEADKVVCDHVGGVPKGDVAYYQAVSCSRCGKHLGTVIPTSDGGKTLG